jgi:hypothetical protein
MIIAISGKQGSGKTFLSNNLKKHLRAHSLKFANVLYLLHDEVYKILSRYGIEKPDKKDGELLQMLGTDWARKKYPGIWVNILKNRIESFSSVSESPSDENYIIDDLRFRDEFDGLPPETIKIRLECDREVRKNRAEYWRENDTHPSEVDLDDYVNKFDLIINTSFTTIEETFNAVLEYFEDERFK